jgi:hypothetical protein
MPSFTAPIAVVSPEAFFKKHAEEILLELIKEELTQAIYDEIYEETVDIAFDRYLQWAETLPKKRKNVAMQFYVKKVKEMKTKTFLKHRRFSHLFSTWDGP